MREYFMSMFFAIAMSVFLLSGCANVTVPTQDSSIEGDLGVSPSPEIKEVSPAPTEPVTKEEPLVDESVDPATPDPTVEPTEEPVPTAEPVTVSYDETMLYVSEFELVDGVLTVTFISDDGEPVGTISYPVSDDCLWETEYVDGMIVPSTYEDIKTEQEIWYTIYVNDDYYESPIELGIDVVNSVIVRVYIVSP